MYRLQVAAVASGCWNDGTCWRIEEELFLISRQTVKVKVKCTLVQALRLCTGYTAHRGSRGIALLFHDHGTRREFGVSVRPRPLFTPGKYTVSIVQEGGWAPRPVWTGAENLAATGIRSPDRPAYSQSLYRLRYPTDSELVDNLRRLWHPNVHYNKCLLVYQQLHIAVV